MIPRAPVVVAAAAALLASSALVAGCASRERAGTTTLTSATVPMSDARAAEIVRDGLDGLASESKLAADRASLARVRTFASAAETAYTDALSDVEDAMGRDGLTPEIGGQSELLSGDARAALRDLSTRPSTDLDHAYVTDLRSLEQRMLDAIDGELLPAVRAPHLRAAILRARATIAARADATKQIHAWLLSQP
jgi:predicted outer membrane protein